ncbi:transposase [Egibacter rhizosphaerae]|uniref:transposase n=1 Tax=Egibacter rhizosphaerae TaxID=1670831 RepID=UPI0030840896
MCIVVCDGLKGLPESIEATWPLAVIQTCVLPPASATPSGWPHAATGTPWPATCGRCTPRPASTPPRSASPTSTSSGASSTPRSPSCGRTAGPSSCPSSTTAPRSAG